MEGQRHNNPLTRVALVYNGPKGMELAPNPHYIVEVAKALGGSFKYPMLDLTDSEPLILRQIYATANPDPQMQPKPSTCACDTLSLPHSTAHCAGRLQQSSV